MTKKLLLPAVIAASLSLASCTLSDPAEVSGNADDLRFTGYTSYGIKLMSVNYDDQDRVTEINIGTEISYTLSYNGSATVPTSITCREYNFGYDSESDKDVRYLSELSEWTGITAANGKYLGSMNVRNTYYSERGATPEVTTGTMHFDYDSNDHITKETITETTNGETTTDVRNFSWSSDLLTGWNDAGSTHRSESATYLYSEVENEYLQWDPNNGAFGPLAITGLLGKAPAKFLKSETTYIDGRKDNFLQHAYTLLDNGLINMAKFSDGSEDDDVALVFNFQYEKK
ncbi:MAG: hypothetical protein NC301_08020 [Bacteroides sp.]|nr:hypothetical protein [Bacteroides sp.]MCM1379443.1 hypothetical protein [Bacteroides sp.]MCM1445304.1 hypothetical protein [Prevotella sp.]